MLCLFQSEQMLWRKFYFISLCATTSCQACIYDQHKNTQPIKPIKEDSNYNLCTYPVQTR